MTAPRGKLVDLPRRPSEASKAACEVAEDLYELGARGDVQGYIVVAVGHDGSIHRLWGFDDRLRLTGAIEAAKQKILEAE